MLPVKGRAPGDNTRLWEKCGPSCQGHLEKNSINILLGIHYDGTSIKYTSLRYKVFCLPQYYIVDTMQTSSCLFAFLPLEPTLHFAVCIARASSSLPSRSSATRFFFTCCACSFRMPTRCVAMRYLSYASQIARSDLPVKNDSARDSPARPAVLCNGPGGPPRLSQYLDADCRRGSPHPDCHAGDALAGDSGR